MRKTFLLFSAVIFGTYAYSQSQRLVLVEAFSNASCGPCASQNPALNNTLATLTTDTVVSVKYQTNWPGVDPMNAQNPSEVASRVTYYNVTGVPTRKLDGNQGGSITTTTVKNRYNVSSPFTISVNHSFNALYDTVFITVTVTASQNFNSANTLKLHTAIVEKEINFSSPPGSNGETNFYSVMRKMLPDQNGTTLPQNWTNGQMQTVNFTAKVPWYIYNLNQFAVVAFIQNNTTQEVHQAGYSAPLTPALPTNLDAALNPFTNLPFITCGTSINPNVVLRNNGSSTLTSVKIYYKIDNDPEQIYNWTGNLAPAQTTNVSIGPLSGLTPGSHKLTVYTAEPNAGVDYAPNNNYRTANFMIVGTPTNTPFSDGFESYTVSTFPPSGWGIDNPNDDLTWSLTTSAGGFGNSSKSARLLFYSIAAGREDYLYLPAYDLSTAPSNLDLKFDVAYAQYQTENDRLRVDISTNCGANWTTLYNKAGSTLSTAPATTSNFVPTASQWRAETVNLNTYVGQPNVLIRFRGTSAYGNNLYIDNINISASVNVNESQLETLVNVYPNPFTDNTNISLQLASNETVDVFVYNNLGQLVYTESKGQLSAGNHNLNLHLNYLDAGVYLVNVKIGNTTVTKKITLVK